MILCLISSCIYNNNYMMLIPARSTTIWKTHEHLQNIDGFKRSSEMCWYCKAPNFTIKPERCCSSRYKNFTLSWRCRKHEMLFQTCAIVTFYTIFRSEIVLICPQLCDSTTYRSTVNMMVSMHDTSSEDVKFKVSKKTSPLKLPS